MFMVHEHALAVKRLPYHCEVTDNLRIKCMRELRTDDIVHADRHAIVQEQNQASARNTAVMQKLSVMRTSELSPSFFKRRDLANRKSENIPQARSLHIKDLRKEGCVLENSHTWMHVHASVAASSKTHRHAQCACIMNNNNEHYLMADFMR